MGNLYSRSNLKWDDCALKKKKKRDVLNRMHEDTQLKWSATYKEVILEYVGYIVINLGY